MKTGELCAGYGGLAMGVQMALGGELAWVADNDPGPQLILAHNHPSVPNLGDITTIDWAWEEWVDLLCAGFPCQDVSCAGRRRGLRAGTRTGVWSHVARAIGELRPSLVLLENVRGLLSSGADSDLEPCPWCLGDGAAEHAVRAAGAVLADLAVLGYDAVWALVPAAGTGVPHDRKRVFILGWPAADPAWERSDRDGGARGWEPGPADGDLDAADTADAQPVPADATPPEADRRPAPGRDRPGSGRGSGSAAAHPAGARPERQTGESRERPPGFPVEPAGGSDRWGQYGPAIARWEAILGRPAPEPTEPGRAGPRLAATFVEWMMGLPEGWVTGVPTLGRTAQLKALGNGCVPQQVALALRLLLPYVPARALSFRAEAASLR